MSYQRNNIQKILIFIHLIHNHNWRDISIIYIHKKASIKRNILTIKQNINGSDGDLSSLDALFESRPKTPIIRK
jgi:hypothetical protein